MSTPVGPAELDLPAAAAQSWFHRGVWLSVGNVTYAVCMWLVLVVLAKTADNAVVGQYALALAVTAPIFMYIGALMIYQS